MELARHLVMNWKRTCLTLLSCEECSLSEESERELWNFRSYVLTLPERKVMLKYATNAGSGYYDGDVCYTLTVAFTPLPRRAPGISRLSGGR